MACQLVTIIMTLYDLQDHFRTATPVSSVIFEWLCSSWQHFNWQCVVQTLSDSEV